MLKRILTVFVLPLVLLFGLSVTGWSNPQQPAGSHPSGTLQKMIVQNGTVTMSVDVDRLRADGSLAAKVEQLRFAVGTNSFFSILVFNDLLRGPQQGSMALIPEQPAILSSLPGPSWNRLVVEKLPSGERFDLA